MQECKISRDQLPVGNPNPNVDKTRDPNLKPGYLRRSRELDPALAVRIRRELIHAEASDLAKAGWVNSQSSLYGSKAFPRHSVVRVTGVPEDGAFIGMLIGFIEHREHGEWAVMEAGTKEGGAVIIPVDHIMRASFAEAEEFAEKWERNLGWRLLRQLRECGALAGTEDEFLRRIINRYIRDRTILDHHKVGADKIYTDAVLKSIGETWPKIPSGKFVGHRVAQLLIGHKLGRAGTILNDLVDFLEKFAAGRDKVLNIAICN
ncbi:phage protein [Pseudomonas phage S50]|uniref:Phage protein n=1 Tax=Pseudomonas phage S50 TaxID=2562638 RepID=A0A455XGS5_9CAUD|nr:phage protein [Pseudomonas phage S50]